MKGQKADRCAPNLYSKIIPFTGSRKPLKANEPTKTAIFKVKASQTTQLER